MKKAALIFVIVFVSFFAFAQRVFPHCDTMDGPVVLDAQMAFEKNNINYILKWVRPDDEAEIKKAFQQAMKVRTLNADAKELAEKYFFDVLVRVHRAGEGVAFTGVKPHGTPVDEKIKAADKSIEAGNLSPLENLVPKEKMSKLKELFDKVMALKNYDVNDVKAARKYIEAYVQFFHFAEGEEEGHAHAAHGDGGHAGHLLTLTPILSGIFFITTLIFGILYFQRRKKA